LERLNGGGVAAFERFEQGDGRAKDKFRDARCRGKRRASEPLPEREGKAQKARTARIEFRRFIARKIPPSVSNEHRLLPMQFPLCGGEDRATLCAHKRSIASMTEGDPAGIEMKEFPMSCLVFDRDSATRWAKAWMFSLT